MTNYNSSHMPDSPSSSFHTNMIAPGVLGVKIIGRLYSMTTGNVWRKTNMELDRISTKRIIVDASEIEYCDGSQIISMVNYIAIYTSRCYCKLKILYIESLLSN